MNGSFAAGLVLALMTGGALAQAAAPAPAPSAPALAAPAPVAAEAPPPPPGGPDTMRAGPGAPPPSGGPRGPRPPGGPGGHGAMMDGDASGGPPPEGPRGHRPPPPPPRAAHIHLQRGDAMLDVRCAEDEPMKGCADLTLQMLDRLKAPPGR